MRKKHSHSAGALAIRYLNIAIAIVAVAALALIYWYAWRPLPKLSGEITSPVSGPVSVAFDALGVPHIHASRLDDAFFVQGYVTAQERLWQMDGLRRLAAGDLAEIVGPSALATDRESRRMRIRRIAEAAYVTLPGADRAAMAAYARGVNHYITTHLSSLPLEFTLLGYQPRPWSVVDSLIVTLYMFADLTTTWRNDVLKQNMLATGDPAKVEFLFPAGAGTGSAPGSNAWALAGSRTASGKPLLSNDMHLEYSLPGIWFMTALQTPEMEVSGVSLPGAPGVIVGHNNRIAWGITNLQFDVQDLYIEKFDDRTGRYIFNGQVEQARLERELIRVKGQPATELVTWVTRHGPMLMTEGNNRLTLRWTAAEPGLLQFPFIEINRARNWQEFTQALSRLPGPGSNFVYADVDGNIGYHVAGQIPVRRGFRGDTPVDGASGQFEWQGFIPFEQLPSAWNPPGGMLVSANQNTFPAGYAYPVNGNFAPVYRAKQIEDRLAARGKWRAEDMLSVQTDIYSGFNKFLAGQLVSAYEKRNQRNAALDPVVDLLRRWNGLMDQEQAAPFVVALAQRYVQTAAAESAAPDSGARYEFTLAPAAVEKLLRERPAGWFRDYDEMLLRALVDAVEEARRIQGPDPAKWQYGAYLRIGLRHPVVGRIPVVGKYFDIQPVPMSGAASTVKQTTRNLAPSMRMNADLGDWERSLLNLQIGQSGHVLSRHYRDQWKYYYEGRSYPMQFRKVESKGTLVFKP